MAQQWSKDPSSTRGGDLGFLCRDELRPGLAGAAFTLTPGTETVVPARDDAVGWYVIRVGDRRSAAVPTFEQARGSLRQELMREALTRSVRKARETAVVHLFNIDGTPMTSADAKKSAAESPMQNR
jgi:parvulin-like peptidyl-prolyl isomerase